MIGTGPPALWVTNRVTEVRGPGRSSAPSADQWHLTSIVTCRFFWS